MTAYTYIDTEADGAGDGTTRSHTTSTGAYASFSSWESSEQTTLTENHIVRCAGATNDTSITNLSGWTTGAYFITIAGDRGEDDSSGGGDNGTGFDDDGFYDGNFSFSDAHYYLTQSAAFNTLIITEPGTIIDGIQINNGRVSASANAIKLQEDDIEVHNCRVSSASGSAINATTLGVKAITNNIVISGGGYGISVTRTASATTNIYNNTVGDAGTGIRLGSNISGDVYNVKNNVVFNTTTEYSGLNNANPTVNATHNAGEGSAPAGHDSDWITLSTTLTDDLTDPENAGGPAADDVRPVSGGGIDNEGIGSGTDANVPTTDILAASRSTTAPSLGAFEVIAAAGFTPKSVFNKPFIGPFGGPI